jgi:hypothetical protein
LPIKKLTDLYVERLELPARGRMEHFDAAYPGLARCGSQTRAARAGAHFDRFNSRLRRFTIGNYRAVQPPAVAMLARWGLLNRLLATGCPPIHTYAFLFGPTTIAGAPGTVESQLVYCARRILLDKLLFDAAAKAGAEICEGFSVVGAVIGHWRVVGIKGRSSRPFPFKRIWRFFGILAEPKRCR